MLFNPPTATAGAGDLIPLTIIAGGAEGLSSGEMEITFDGAGLDVIEVTAGAFLTIDGKQVTFVPVIEQGRILIRFARQEDTVGLRGSGQLARIVFEVLAAGPPSTVSMTGALRDAGGKNIAASFASARIETQ